MDYTHPSGDGEPPWSNDPDERFAFDPNFDEFGDYTQRAIQTLSILGQCGYCSENHGTVYPMGSLLTKYIPYEKHLKSRNPALNIPRRHEAVATNTVFSDTPAVDSGVKQAQVFVGRDTLVADAYPMKSGKQFVNTLEDNIWRQGAMDKLLSDSAKTEISNKVIGHITFQIGILSPTTRTKTLLNGGTGLSNLGPTQS